MAFKLTVLGSNSALPTTNGFPSAHVLNIHEHFFLIDCGEATQIQLRRNKINFNKIERIFITHLHGDHFFGLFGLISTFSLLGRIRNLHIYADSAIKDILYTVLDKETIKFQIIFHPLNFKKGSTIFENNSIIIKSFPLKHRINTCGFYFSEKLKDKNIRKEFIQKYNISIRDIVRIKKGADYTTEDGEFIKNELLTTPPAPTRSYAYCSDTAYSEDIIDTIKNVDLLYHEATFEEEDLELATKTGHSTGKQAALIAKQAKTKKLLIGHFSTRYPKTDTILEEAKEIFENTIAVQANDFFEVIND